MLKLLAIISFAFIIRFIGINWDSGFHLHPDERMLIMVTERINFFNKLNPDFFNYGSLPVYILKGTAQILEQIFKSSFTDYDNILKVGRFISVIFDLGIIALVYALANKLFRNKKIALLSAFFYSLAFFPIQNSHFFVVDVPLTFLSTLLVLLITGFQTDNHKLNIKRITLIGINFAAILATKFSGIIFLPLIILRLLLNPLSNRNKVRSVLLLLITAAVFFYLFMPYAFIEHIRFFTDVRDQMQMNSNPYIFPYTLQYVGTIPYFYYLKNIFIWGLGPVISTSSIVGLIFSLKYLFANFQILNKTGDKANIITFKSLIFFVVYYLFYFLIMGRSAVKFMRYMLPLYPFFSIMAGYGIYRLSKVLFFSKINKNIEKIIIPAGIMLTILWTVFFLNIYTQQHTRLVASDWINSHIPAGSALALEHWDDGLPVRGGERYKLLELTLYDQPDNDLKWQKQDSVLDQADYLIIASNRLYTPLQKLSDCKKYKSCYPKTADYYHELFAGKLPFKKVAEFTAYPGLKLGKFSLILPDDTADESFTVYDHPKIMIFKKIK